MRYDDKSKVKIQKAKTVQGYKIAFQIVRIEYKCSKSPLRGFRLGKIIKTNRGSTREEASTVFPNVSVTIEGTAYEI
jgi:hypothetical protein